MQSNNTDPWLREQALLSFNKIKTNEPIDEVSKQLSLSLIIIFLEDIQQKTSADIKLIVDCSFKLIQTYRQSGHHCGVVKAYYILHRYIMKFDHKQDQFVSYVKDEREINTHIYQHIRSYGFEPIDILQTVSFFDIAEKQIITNTLSKTEIDLRAFALRAFTVKHIMVHLDVYKAYIKQDTTDYLRDLAQTNGHVDRTTILAFSREYNITVVVIDSKKGELYIIKRTNPAATIYVGYETDYRFIHLKQNIINPVLTEKIAQTPIDVFPEKTFKKFDKSGIFVTHSMFYRTSLFPTTLALHPYLGPFLK